MAYTMEQYQKDHFVRRLPYFFNDAKIQDGILQTISSNWTVKLTMQRLRSIFSVKDIVSSLSPDERLEGLAPDERLKGLAPDERLEGLAPDERLKGLSSDEIQAYLQKLEQSSDN